MDKDNAYMQRTLDLKKWKLLYLDRIQWIIWITLVCVMLFSGMYQIYKILHEEGKQYRVSSDYYITFNFDDYENSVDYYNAYTWDSILRDDPIVVEALRLLPKDYTKAELQAAITGEMLGDYRILTVHATHQDRTRAEAIAEAYEKSLEVFADKIDMLNTIELWSRGECQPVVQEDLTANAALLGAILGIVIAVFAVGFDCLLDDSVYVEKDFTGQYAAYSMTEEGKQQTIPLLGILTQRKDEMYLQRLRDNMQYLLKADGTYFPVSAEEAGKSTQKAAVWKSMFVTAVKALQQESVSIGEYTEPWGENLKKLRTADGVVLLLPWGQKNGRRYEQLIEFLRQQKITIAGAVIIDADDRFLKSYYGGKKKQK